MKIEKIDTNIIKVTVEQDDCNPDEYGGNSAFLESKNILTFGDYNHKIFEKFFVEKSYNPQYLDLCFDDDKSIGLEVPKTWYLNRGAHALSIAAYYNYLSLQGVAESANLFSFNKKITDEYGIIACVEIYLEKELKPLLHSRKIKYFGTPRTLTECIRYLEGWNLKEYPRLKDYAVFSKFIELWSKANFPSFKPKEWHLGKEKSNEINKTELTNVRKAVRYFWENYLLNSRGELSDEDIEVDILEGEKFRDMRQPKVILLSEDIFSEDKSGYEVFGDLMKKLSKDKVYISKSKNNFPGKNAKIAKMLFPHSLIVLIENDKSFHKNFSLINPLKHAVNADIVVTAKILRYIFEKILYE